MSTFVTPEGPATSAAREVAELARRLRSALRAQGSTARGTSLRIGRSAHYLSRAFAGRNPLKLKDVAALLGSLGGHPRAFFGRHYPLGGSTYSPEMRERILALRPQTVRFDDLAARVRAQEPIPSPEETVERACRVLRGLIVERGTNQRAVSLALGLSRDTLGQALRGGMDLEMWHVFGVLLVVGVSPARFFRELYAPGGEALGGVAWPELVALLEGLLSGAAEPLAAILRQEPNEKPEPGG